MDLALIVGLLVRTVDLAMPASVLLLALAIGLAASRPGSLAGGLRPPQRALRAIAVLGIGAPVLALVIASALRAPSAVRGALLAASLAPLPLALGGAAERRERLPLALLAALASVATVPLGIAVLGRALDPSMGAPAPAIALAVGARLLLPLAAGFALGRFSPERADVLGAAAERWSLRLLWLAMVPVAAIGAAGLATLAAEGSLPVVAAAVAAAAAASAALARASGEPWPARRRALVEAALLHHPGASLAIARLATSDDPPVQAVVLLHLLAGAAIAAALRRRPERGSR